MTTTPAPTPTRIQEYSGLPDMTDDAAWYDFILTRVKPMLDDPSIWRPCALAIHDETRVMLLRMIARHNMMKRTQIRQRKFARMLKRANV